MDVITDVLESVGFEAREIKVYLILLKIQLATALKISQAARIDRTTTYDILERMIDKGVASSIVMNNAKHFSVLPPRELLSHFKEKYDSLERMMPRLEQMTRIDKEATRFEVFQGLEGIKSVLADLISSKKDYFVIGIKKEYEETLSYFNEHGLLKLNELNVKETAIVGKGEKFKRLKNGEYRYINEGLISPVTTLLYQDRVIFFVWTDPKYAIFIENKAFARGYREYFDILWKIAKG